MYVALWKFQVVLWSLSCWITTNFFFENEQGNLILIMRPFCLGLCRDDESDVEIAISVSSEDESVSSDDEEMQ